MWHASAPYLQLGQRGAWEVEASRVVFVRPYALVAIGPLASIGKTFQRDYVCRERQTSGLWFNGRHLSLTQPEMSPCACVTSCLSSLDDTSWRGCANRMRTARAFLLSGRVPRYLAPSPG